ncbi:MAG: DUF1963 domain-containing protein [Verrucomicrobiaceae bacterium]|nr:DUF1963 domain-containing protein [Verrucomicrobiaceae bacterium]
MDFLVLTFLALFLIITGTLLQNWWRRKNGLLDPDEEPPVVMADLKRCMDSLSKPAMLIRKTSETTSSWLGGCPPEHDSFVWPRCGGRPLTFLACLDLSETGVVTDWLPPSGRLLFFYDVEEMPGA